MKYSHRQRLAKGRWLAAVGGTQKGRPAAFKTNYSAGRLAARKTGPLQKRKLHVAAKKAG